MEPFYKSDEVVIYCADCIDLMAELPENSLDAIVTDPPYGLEFMGKEWDKLEAKGHWDGNRGWQGDVKDVYGRYQGTALTQYRAGIEAQLFHQQWASQALRVLKPGGHALVFGGTRTHHRMYCGLEDAGFEIRDTICWLYGSGFPKSHDISKAIDKMVGAEGEIIGSKKLWGHNAGSGAGSFSKNQYEGQTGIVRYEDITSPGSPEAKEWQGYGTALKPAFEPILLARKTISEKNVALNVLKWGVGGLAIDACRVQGAKGNGVWGTNQTNCQGMFNASPENKEYKTQQHTGGRWPANVVLDEEAAQMLDEQAGQLKSGKQAVGGHKRNTDKHRNTFMPFEGQRCEGDVLYGDSGGASRFFQRCPQDRFLYCPKASKKERGQGNDHPTVKPMSLCRWLIQLVSRPGQVVLDPFAGSMTIPLAALETGRKCIAVEKSPDYCKLFQLRLPH